MADRFFSGKPEIKKMKAGRRDRRGRKPERRTATGRVAKRQPGKTMKWKAERTVRVEARRRYYWMSR